MCRCVPVPAPVSVPVPVLLVQKGQVALVALVKTRWNWAMKPHQMAVTTELRDLIVKP